MNSNLVSITDQSLSVTIKSTDWNNDDAPYSCKITNSKFLSNSNIDITLDSSATDSQALVYVSAALVPGFIENGSLTIKAYGRKPKVDIPLAILIHGEERS